jgi:hypothetical protein
MRSTTLLYGVLFLSFVKVVLVSFCPLLDFDFKNCFFQFEKEKIDEMKANIHTDIKRVMSYVVQFMQIPNFKDEFSEHIHIVIQRKIQQKFVASEAKQLLQLRIRETLEKQFFLIFQDMRTDEHVKDVQLQQEHLSKLYLKRHEDFKIVIEKEITNIVQDVVTDTTRRLTQELIGKVGILYGECDRCVRNLRQKRDTGFVQEQFAEIQKILTYYLDRLQEIQNYFQSSSNNYNKVRTPRPRGNDYKLDGAINMNSSPATSINNSNLDKNQANHEMNFQMNHEINHENGKSRDEKGVNHVDAKTQGDKSKKIKLEVEDESESANEIVTNNHVSILETSAVTEVSQPPNNDEIQNERSSRKRKSSANYEINNDDRENTKRKPRKSKSNNGQKDTNTTLTNDKNKTPYNNVVDLISDDDD